MNKHQPSPVIAAGALRPRDPRLDFFRGIAMFIIFVSHTPGNTWTLWIPARFGFSDATEIFVFCSGMASAIAFGKIFEDRGWWMGTARVSFRVWQVYWAHVTLLLFLAGWLAFLQIHGMVERDYVGGLNLWHLFEDPIFNIPGILTLTYVPNYFDILPMYLVILALMPVMLLAYKTGGRTAVAGLAIALWLAANFRYLDLPAEPWSDRRWFFNPFGWQLLFFTGFALMRGWIPRPPVKKSLLVVAAIIVLASVPFSYFRVFQVAPVFLEMARDIKVLTAKTEFGIFRYLHFLALAYLAWTAVGEGGKYLLSSGLWGKVVTVIQKVGQQSLAVFLASLVIAQTLAIVRNEVLGGKTALTELFINLAGFAGLIAVAYTVSWYKKHPWRAPAHNAK
ncbi:OpgC domain-containing protein [Pseudovibrio exalbescens]|uniref:OpgC family protein n=1 Tax=Pseudovibrio exalbescens TaxID=197461 RepID=UPI002366099C|nr:OpgC domain-containing protein [Pseudovibrio exalbescens]MDD7909905.1 OpgC domain-containing protein [Pseudovibrio exalbescens]